MWGKTRHEQVESHRGGPVGNRRLYLQSLPCWSEAGAVDDAHQRDRLILAQQCGLREMDYHPFCRGPDQQNRIVD
jgi:hypothetical protein